MLIWEFVELLKAKKELSGEEAFLKAGIKGGRVEYICPLCGGTAVAVRHIHCSRYHGLGSDCKSCGGCRVQTY